MRHLATPTCLALLLLATSTATAQRPPAPPLVPESFTLSASARQALSAEWLTDEERADLRVFHGVWDDRDLTSSERRAIVALNAWRFEDPALADPEVLPELRAEALLRRGDLAGAIDLLGTPSDGHANLAARIRAEAQEGLGNARASEQAAAAAVRRMQRDKLEDAAELCEGVRAMIVLTRLQGQPARDFQTMMHLLGRAHQQLDRLYWPAMLAEAELLIDKDNVPEAVAALHDALQLNPRCAGAWYALGRVALQRFDFDSTGRAVAALRRIDAEHPLAVLLAAESRLVQDDPEEAVELLGTLTAQRPRIAAAHALTAAAYAMLYDDDALQAALARHEALAPGGAGAFYTVGRFLSLNRQYGAAARMLEEAVRRRPAWPAPQIELGLMELQSGRDARAFAVLSDVVALDPFNKRAANSFALLEEVVTYEEVETAHFVIRYKPGVDQVVAEMMPEPLEEIHALVSSRFGWAPEGRTVIELYPDHERFSVRITGMPWIHTVAASTGPVIALEAPREGPAHKHLGVFDWRRVIQHEYTHTITLDQTRNRIPHWLTEAAAVSMERAPRTYANCLMLAAAYHEGTLFDLDQIKWAFVRPKQPGDRGKAYAQGHWMVEYMDERFGESALIRLLEQYFEGKREQEAIPAALGESREQFFRGFLQWAGHQVKAWGLDAQPSLVALTDELRWADPEAAVMMAASQQARLDVIAERVADQIGRPARRGRRPIRAADWPPLMRPEVKVSSEQLAAWLELHPEHPDLVELDLRRRIERLDGPDASVVPDLERYAAMRPVDPFPHKKLAEYWLGSDTPQRAVAPLEELDIREEKTPVYALELARLYRQQGDLHRALAKSTRALQIDPYHASNREFAAGIAIEAGRPDLARRHIMALTLLEPDRPQHAKRLEAIDRMMEE